MNFMKENVWVWAGTGLVLITLSGATRRYGIYITLLAILLHSIATYLDRE